MTPLPTFPAAHVLVCGDVMLDRYWSGTAHRISPEAPVPVLGVDHEDLRPGGAANVALGVAALGARCTLLGLTGDDREADAVAALLDAVGVEARLRRVPDWRTTTKLRVTSRAQQLLRLDFEAPLPAGEARALQSALTETVLEALPRADVLLCSDYAKGALGDASRAVDAARRAGVPVVVDPKDPDFERWRGATVLKPNLAEFVAATGGVAPADLDELHARGRALRERLAVDALLVTRGGEGMSLLTAGTALDLPTRNRDVFDVTGAGDTVAAVLAASLAAGATITDAVRLANVAAGIAVGHAGTVAVSAASLRSAVEAVSASVLSRDALLEAVAVARGAGERIVFTNGCFDLLHAGHVAYLEEARALGDRLVGAINGDASVRRLKGADRPFNDAADRARVLAALRAVDWVTVFDEDTPEALLEVVVPDVLVKGGDYAPQDVVGAAIVRARGGQVAVLGLQPGRSTTGIAERVRRG
ncbi:MAG: bifunctional D-glycero-beta-D-manno-heptose-7-phosphate kinase/D-glycero-beta-D-manno-heptose 1-phosphate adenylyltransferase HldE [Pseudomonadales bacterium]|jgi:D-beta-D-heptose 7-phosphate kinase/D-beta-D-heptose 1-phosphate adenosyltransferase|nr:bifunctional D-glycero-beta-D-manno-heptose-7-phosphate kinase/D-glycero-beta-D-manno-heptose 1-phosphate adenylyltransferase HldE [Pseudomonadales bacterium]